MAPPLAREGECLDWLLIVNRRNLQRVLCVFVSPHPCGLAARRVLW
jgi:hypothetical protein